MTITLHTVTKAVLVISIIFQIGFLLTEGFNSDTQTNFISANILLLIGTIFLRDSYYVKVLDNKPMTVD